MKRSCRLPLWNIRHSTSWRIPWRMKTLIWTSSLRKHGRWQIRAVMRNGGRNTMPYRICASWTSSTSKSWKRTSTNSPSSSTSKPSTSDQTILATRCSSSWKCSRKTVSCAQTGGKWTTAGHPWSKRVCRRCLARAPRTNSSWRVWRSKES